MITKCEVRRWRMGDRQLGDISHPTSHFLHSGGFALVVILAFVVLLTVLVLAYFSYSSLQRQISNSSSAQATVDIFAQGAINTIVTDFKQEIAAGSTINIYGTNTVYLPLASSNAAPVRVGTSTNLPNLVKRSAGGLAFFPSGTIRASAISSTNASQNGRSISSARWNKALLLPKADTNSVSDFTPTNAFTAPDWIYVNRGGGNPTNWNTALRWNSAPSDTNVVVGRYSYTIYDEGGLLDVNVAGYPPGTTNAISGYKNPLSYADLTQVGLATNTISALVGWRNAASAQPTGAFPNYTFNAASQTNFYNSVSTNALGFLRTANTNIVGGETDRMFISRQHFLQFFDTLGDGGVQTKAQLQNAVQYLGTFSRALEQPSFAPHPNRPVIVGSALPPSPSSVNTYSGNNTYWGGDSVINLKNGGFLSVRVQNPFVRLNGTQAVVGEPLVKTKFALSHLVKVNTAATAAQSASDPIYSRFGLFRASASQPWTYNHGATNVLTLTAVATRNREPDFAELLKAAINAGSVGKAGPSGQGDNDQYRMDASGDHQILQIMANLIDQAKTDNYPTRIQFVDSTGTTRTIYGTQDLPYFYNWHFFSTTTRVPSPLLNEQDTVTIISGTTSNKFDHARVKDPAAPFDPGSASYFIIPQIWNPHDANTPQPPGGGPTNFRFLVETRDPAGNRPFWQINVRPGSAGGHHDGGGDGTWPQGNAPASAQSPHVALSSANATLQFTDLSGGRAFREPTLLWRNGIPSGVSLVGASRTEDSSLTGKTYYGILIGDAQVSWVNNVGGTDYIFQASAMSKGNYLAPGGSQPDNMTFRMQYQDASGNWVTYQEMYVESNLTEIPAHTLFVNRADYTSTSIYSNKNEFANPLMIGVNASGSQLTEPMGGAFDPRSARFTSPIKGRWKMDDPTLNGNPTLDAVALVANNDPSAVQNLAVANTNFVLMKTQRPSTSRGQMFTYTTPCRGYNATMRWYSSLSWTPYAGGFDNGGADTWFFGGMLSQNSPAARLLSKDAGSGSIPQSIYYEDPDGVARRAMGGYVPTSGSPSGFLTTTTTTVGLPMATSGSVYTGGIVTPSVQSQSRPIVLHRPFRSVAEMSYAFRGTPWKNLDFFSPESGDTGLLDVFCVDELPADGLVAGRLSLNTRQPGVLAAVFSGAYRDELANIASPPVSGTQSPLSETESRNLANTLISITSGTDAWRGPLANVGDVVGRYISPNPPSVSGADVYQYTSPAGSVVHTFAGFSAALSDSAIWQNDPASSRYIQRFREAAIRPLVNAGQARVWNVMIDVVAQNGRFSYSASALNQFSVEGEKRLWVHLAIDRVTGKIVDKQVELVSE